MRKLLHIVFSAIKNNTQFNQRMFKKGKLGFWKYGQGTFGEIRTITDNLLTC